MYVYIHRTGTDNDTVFINASFFSLYICFQTLCVCYYILFVFLFFLRAQMDECFFYYNFIKLCEKSFLLLSFSVISSSLFCLPFLSPPLFFSVFFFFYLILKMLLIQHLTTIPTFYWRVGKHDFTSIF